MLQTTVQDIKRRTLKRVSEIYFYDLDPYLTKCKEN